MFKKLILLTLAAILLLSSSAFAEYDTLWTKYTHNIFKLEFSKDDSKILTVGNQEVIIFATEDGEELHQIPTPAPDIISDACYSHDGSLIIVAREAFDEQNFLFGFIDIYGAYTYDLIRTINLPQISMKYGNTNVRLSNDGTTLAVVNIDGIYFIDFSSGDIKKHIYYGQSNQHYSLGVVSRYVYSKDDKYLIMTVSDKPKGENTKLQFLNTETYEIDYVYNKGKWFLTISDDGSMIAFLSDDDNIAVSIMDTETKEIVGNIGGNAGSVTSIAFSNDNKYLLIGGLNGMYGLKIYTLYNLQQFDEIYPNTSFSTVDINGNNDRIVFSLSNKLILLDYRTSNISDNSKIEEILFPNPSTNTVNLIFTVPLPKIISLSVTDNLGNKILSMPYGIFKEGTHTIQYDCSKLPNGVYYLTLSGKSFKKTYKLIKEG